MRRLVSEGTRPRLPWAPRLRAFQQDPRPVIELLELLKDDPSLYVRRSVANNLNDIGKDHPELLVTIAKRWLRGAVGERPSPERRWIVNHALRSAVKRAHAGALGALGYGGKAEVAVRKVTIEPGGVFGPLHDHKDRPGMVYILQGTITDHRDGVAKEYGPGLGWPEDENTTHWLENRGTTPAVEISVSSGKSKLKNEAARSI